MPFIYNFHNILKVNRVNSNEVLSECTYLSNDLEITGWIVTDIASLEIKWAGWAVYRSPQDSIGHYEIPELKGIVAYLNSGPDLKRVLGGEKNELVREIISDCVRGIVQAESYLYLERGYKNAAHYNEYWDEMYAHSCRYYSNLYRKERTWMEHVGDDTRLYNQFNRLKSVNVSQADNGDYMVSSTFSDSFHQLGTQLILSSEGMVESAEGKFDRGPDKICFENIQHLQKIIGCKLSALSKKEIAAMAGGSEGCDHLVAVLYESARVMKQIMGG